MSLLKKLFVIVVMTLGVGCSAPKNITYFQDLDDGAVVSVQQDAEIKLKNGDKLTILVHSRNPEIASQFNLSVSANRVGSTTNANSSYLMSAYVVSDQGTVDLPGVGELKIVGLNRAQVLELVKDKLIEGEFFVNPEDFSVTVEFDNMFFTILGEIARQGRYSINKDKLTIFEALGMAGDLSIQGQRCNVKLLRDENGSRKVYVLDLTNGKELLASPAYYLQQDDVIYVEGNNVRKRQATVNGNTVRSGSFWLSIASVLSSLYVIFLK